MISASVTSTGFSPAYNDNGATYVAYLFAHDAGGFGLSGTDNVISCGSLVSTGGVVDVNLGYETQWLLIKNASNIDSWYMYDTMRGMSMTDDYYLKANNSNAESNFGVSYVKPTATGFSFNSSAFGASGETYIYIAIRRGPMKVPTSGTSVFSPTLGTASGAPRFVSGFPVDLFVKTYRYGYLGSLFGSRLTGDKYMSSASTSAEASDSTFFKFDYQNGTSTAGDTNDIGWLFRRAPGFFDVVCYTGTGSARTVAHNLGAVPELMIVKDRPTAGNGRVYTASGGAGVYLRLFSTSSDSGNTATTTIWNNTAPTSSVFSVGASSESNFNARTYVAYLFGTVAGVSKVGSYTGTGATQTINCGFSSGSRFVLIKKSTSTAPDRNWYVWDSARGITSGNDPYLLLNTTDAEVTSTDYINTAASGFQIVTSDDAVNASGVTYIFLAIA